MHRWNILGIAVGSALLFCGTAAAINDAHRRPALLMGGTTTDSIEAVTPPENTPVFPPSAIGGGPLSEAAPAANAPASVPGAGTGASAAGTATAQAAEGSPIGSGPVAASPTVPSMAVPAPTGSLAAPVYGAPPLETPSGVPAVGNATPGDKPLYLGSSGGSPNPGIVNAKPTIVARVLVPMSDAATSENYWSTITPFLRGGDLIVAKAQGAGDQALGWSDRVRADAPLVGYAVAFDRADSLEAALAKLPAGLDVVGLSTTAGIDDKKLTDLSNKVHAAGRRFFVSTSLTPGVSLATLGARADVVELVADPATAKTATGALMATGNPQIFVRIASATAGRALETANTSNTILKDTPSSGLSLPYSDQVGQVLSDLRAQP